MRRRLWAIAGMVALVGAGALLAAVPLNATSARNGAALPSGNLVLNPGAEAGLTGWSNPFGVQGFEVVAYGAAGGFPGTDVANRIGGQQRFFAGGKPLNTNFYALAQDVDISNWATQIDAGDVAMKLSAFIGGYLSDPDLAYVQFIYRPPNQKIVVSLGPVQPADRANQTDLIPLSKTVNVPAGTRLLNVWLSTQIKSGSYNDAYFDNISVELISKTAPTTSSTTTTGSTTTTPTTTSSPSTTTVTKTVTTTTPTTTGSPGSTTTTNSPPSLPKPKPAKSSLSLACSKKTLVATVKPAKGTKVSSVWFYVNGKLKTKDRKTPFVAAIPTKGLSLPLRVTAAVQVASKSTFLRKQFRGC